MGSELPYTINDADNHFTEPDDCFVRYIDPKDKDLAITPVRTPDGKRMQLFAGKPSKFMSSESNQTVFSDEALKEMLGTADFHRTDADDDGPRMTVIPGSDLNRLNPLKGMNEEERKAFVQEFRNKAEAFGNRDLRLALMDEQGIDKAFMFPAAAHDIEYEFVDNIPALYANIRAFNRWMGEEVGFVAEDRMFLPPYIAFADPDLAVKELKQVIKDGAKVIQTKSGHAHGGKDNPYGGRSLADPIFDEFWNICNDANIRLAVHLGGTDYQKYGADWSEDPNAVFGDFTAFQWMHYWGDRTAFELTSALILQNFFGRFPNMKVCLSELGTVWLPYTCRKMDHAFLMGRKAKWAPNGRLDARPSEIFRKHFIVAPYPEENVQRVVAEIGIEPIVFGSDFPHGEGLAYPGKYAAAQLGGFSDADVKLIMRDNMENFLAGAGE
ncbi:MAG: amidohydrolase family protein [Acidobacteria bacterium]|nr:amidohydrolase family protein [Acidobacteriota bacterium]